MMRRSRRDPNEPPTWQLVERHRAGATLDDLASLCRSGRLKIRDLLVVADAAIRPKGGWAGARNKS